MGLGRVKTRWCPMPPWSNLFLPTWPSPRVQIGALACVVIHSRGKYEGKDGVTHT